MRTSSDFVSVLRIIISALGMVSWVVGSTPALAGVALFTPASDTVRVDNNTVSLGGAATYEARILFTAQHAGGGLVYNEHSCALEDKQLKVGPAGISAFSYGLATETPGEISAIVPVSSNVWHHIAYVYDGSQERLYLDGALVRSRAASGTIRNGAGFAAVGSNWRECEGPNGRGWRAPGFVGYLDTLRISTIARYHGEGFTPPSGDLSSDAHTALLYNFNEPSGSVLTVDEGPLMRTGRLGLPPGTSATSPSLTHDPVPRLNLTRSGQEWLLTWEGPHRLQSAPGFPGPFSDVPGATSPFSLGTAESPERYFRLGLAGAGSGSGVRGVSGLSLAEEVPGDTAAVGMGAVFPEVDPLPGAEARDAVPDRD